MKVELQADKESLLIKPETDFEENWLVQHYEISNCTVYIKRGASIADILGLKIYKEKENERAI